MISDNLPVGHDIRALNAQCCANRGDIVTVVRIWAGAYVEFRHRTDRANCTGSLSGFEAVPHHD